MKLQYIMNYNEILMQYFIVYCNLTIVISIQLHNNAYTFKAHLYTSVVLC